MQSASRPIWSTDAENCAEWVLSKVGKNLVIGLPLGLGKANTILNAIYARAEADPSINLRIFTALTLARPMGSTDLEKKFISPLFQRLAGDYPELAYNAPLQQGHLPPNISVHEFYFPAGRRLGAPRAQQLYTSTNYTHAARDLLDNGINVITQLVAQRNEGDHCHLSLSCNPDITLDLLPELKRRRVQGQQIAITGQVNDRLPFMHGPAVVEPDEFDLLLHGPQHQFDLFAIPKQPVSLADYAAAFHVAALVKDGGTLQIGIGGFADALTHALKLRHQHNDQFRTICQRLGLSSSNAHLLDLGRFEEGLYGCSEMLVEGLLELKRIGVIKRRAKSTIGSESSEIGPAIHAAFFLGSRALYEQLRSLDEKELEDIAMTSVSFVNHLYGDESIKRASRQHARFVNRGMMATALGAVVSDGLEDGRVISGVGGQYNFVAQAHELEGARSIMVVHALRASRGKASSNIVWNYGHTTIPRHPARHCRHRIRHR